MRQYFVYIVANKMHNVLYIGVTNDLERRMYEHKHKLVEGFTKKYNVDKLVYYNEFSSINDAIAAEKKLKGWTRAKKVALIEQFNPEWKDLTQEILHFTVFRSG